MVLVQVGYHRVNVNSGTLPTNTKTHKTSRQKGPKPLCTSAEQHQCLCGQLQLEQGRESLVKYAQQEKIAED